MAREGGQSGYWDGRVLQVVEDAMAQVIQEFEDE
jgi:hypothetical protein